MSDTNHVPQADILNQAVEALREASPPTGPSPELLAATVAAVQAKVAVVVPGESSREQRRRKIMRYVRYSFLATAAAVLLTVVGGMLLNPGRSVAAEFKRGMEKAEQAKSMTCKNTQRIGSQAEIVFNFSFQDSKLRMDMLTPAEAKPKTELPHLISYLVDVGEKKGMEIRHVDKTVIHRPIVEQKTNPFPNLMEGFRLLKGETKVAIAGEEKIGDKETTKFTLDNAKFLGATGPAKVTIWLDKKTELPVKIVVENAGIDPKEGKMYLLFEEFEFDKLLDPKLFEMKVPEGYTVKESK